MKKLLILATAISLCISTPALAIGTLKINPESPILTDSPMIANIFEKSCAAGSNENMVTIGFPDFMKDGITEQFEKLYPPQKLAMWNSISSIVAAGYDFGRTLALTDLNGIDIEDQCKLYSINFTAVIINDELDWDRTGHAHSSALLKPLFIMLLSDNPLNDVLAPKESDQINITPRIAEENGCRYMYYTLANNPIIQVDPFDITLEIMENMIWHDYNYDTIRRAYHFLLQGAKEGQYLFQNKQDIKSCYV